MGNDLGVSGFPPHRFQHAGRDGLTGLDYIDQRYYVASYGRFNTADPYQASAGPSDPGSWNRYAYVGGDPINRNDRRGLCWVDTSNSQYYGTYQDWSEATYQGTAMTSDYLQETNDSCDDDDPVYSTVLYDQPPLGGTTSSGNGGSTSPPPPPCPPKYQAYINSYGAYATATGLSEANVLALSSIESDWGNGRFAKGGNSFFNLETLAPIGWKPGDPFPNTIYPDQVSWMNALEPFASGSNAGRYSLVATYQNASDAFSSFAARLGQYFSGVTNAATFGGIAVHHGIYAGRGNAFISREQNFQDCLGAQ